MMALRGIKVVEFAGLAPAPFCGMILADFGAQVIRIDKPLGLNTVDSLGNGKKSVALNLKHEKSIEIVRKLCKQSDVLIEPYRRGVMEKLGLGPQILLADNPKLIYARLTGYGQHGPFSNRAGHDINYVGLSGLLSMFGRAHDKPMFPVNLAADFGGGGLTCALGILMALYERSKSGLGQVIDSNMVEGTAYLGSWLFRSKNPLFLERRGENLLDSGAHFYEVYETKDGKFMCVGALEEQFYRELLAGLELSEDDLPQWGSYDKGKEILTNKFKEKTQQEWCEIFNDVDACVTPLLSTDDAPNHLHNKARESFIETDDGTVLPKPAPILSRTPAKSKAMEQLPQIGQHTRETLQNLGYSAQELNELEEQEAIKCFQVSKL